MTGNFLLRYREGTGPIRVTMRLGRDANQAKMRLRAERKGRECKIIGCKETDEEWRDMDVIESGA